MINVEDRYFSLNRTLLLAVGLWPHKKSKLAQFQFISFFGILTSCITFQLTTFVTSECTADLVIKVLAIAISFILFAIQYSAFNINGETVRYLMEQLQRIYNDLKDNNEFIIIEKYGSNAKRFTSVLTILIISDIFAIMIVQFWQDVFYIIFSVNQSRPQRWRIMAEYFVDEEKYFYLLFLHMIAAICIGLVATVAIGAMFVTYLIHICGMFRIASYRIKHSMQIYTLQRISLSIENKIHEDIVCAIDIHRKAMMFCKLLITRFEISFMFLILFGIISLSLNAFRIVTFDYNAEEFIILFTNALFSLTYMFVASVLGQEIIEHNNHIFATAYEIQWYMAPLHIQKLILFLLQRGNKEFVIKVGLLVASLQCFTTMTNASITYFTVMHSVQL